MDKQQAAKRHVLEFSLLKWIFYLNSLFFVKPQSFAIFKSRTLTSNKLKKDNV
jgi:hypothetical protein